jgi:hypothetical protein
MSEETTPRTPAGDSGEDEPQSEPRGRLPLGTPRQFGRYETWRLLGSGTFGRVYLARDPLVGRFVAIKAPKDPLPPEEHRAFLREARVIAGIHHENVCPVYDVGFQDDCELPFIVLRYVTGGTLADLIARDPPPPTQALRFAQQVASGLAEAHARGIFHRDLKPANVLYDDKAGKALIADFGLARWLESPVASSGGAKGTPAFMAPEQWAPRGPFGDISERTDVYSLGVMLFHMLTGARPFDGTQHELMFHHCNTAPRRPTEVRPGLDPRLDALCLKALAKQPSDRFRSAREFAEAIAECLRAPAPRPDHWRITVPGTWWSRPAGDPLAQWKAVADTPAEVTVRPGEVYQLGVDPDAPDDALDGLAALESLTALEMLFLCACENVTDAGLASLQSLPNLRTLVLNNCDRITDLGLYLLKPLTSLQSLDLGSCPRLTDGGLLHLQRLINLRALRLWGCRQITDAGLAHLHSLRDLRELHLQSCDQITDAGVAALQVALPNCRVHR